MKMRGTPVPFYQSLNRPFLVFGVERMIFFGFLSLILPLPLSAHFTLTMDFIAIGLFVVLHAAGLMITRTDPQMLEVFKRHIHYRKYYDAISGIHAQNRILKHSVPYYVGKKGLV